VREALARAKASARERGVVRGTKRRSAADREPRFSGPRPDERDPQRVGAEIDRMVADNGWRETAQIATVLACWDRLVGADLASHCRPDRLTDGELVLVAESTAWATQVRLMTAAILAKLAAELGQTVVRSIRVFGPSGPDWRHGGRRVPGRGPRDTYG
jgi:predicted nucleic acid-binding Zn ribbon protein